MKPSLPPRALHAPLLAALAAGLMAACSGTLLPRPEQPAARYTLDTGPAPAAPAAPAVTAAPAATLAGRPAASAAPVLTVDLPRAAPGHDSRRMVYLQRPQELQDFAFHEWVATPAEMLAPLLVRAIQDNGAFRAVLSAPATVAGSWHLQTEGLRLQQDFTHQPSRVRLSLRAVLLDGSTRQVLAWHAFDIDVQAAADDPVAGAQAAQAAAQQLGVAVAAFCAGQARNAVNQPR